MLLKTLVSAGIAATALAQPLHQHHQHEKRAVATVTVVVDAAGNVITPSTSAATNAASTKDVTTSAVYSTLSESTVASASTVNSQSSSSSSSSFSGPAKGITYSPYAADGTCKSQSDIATEVALLSDYEIIRLYGVDCNQVEYVTDAMADNQLLFAGIYYMDAITSGVQTLATAVEASIGWSRVHTVSIGNEFVNDGTATTDQIKSYVSEGREALTSAGYTGPVVSVDTLVAVQNNPVLCDYSDYIAVNSHPYFDGNVVAANSGPWLETQIANIKSICGGEKSVLITETGWPTKGDTYGKAVPGTSEQTAALDSISDSCGDQVLFFNAYNDLWKADGAYGVEKYWGIYTDPV